MPDRTEFEMLRERAEAAEAELLRRDRDAVRREIAERTNADRLADQTAKAEAHKHKLEETERRRHSAWINFRCDEARTQGNNAFVDICKATLAATFPRTKAGRWAIARMPCPSQSYRMMGRIIRVR